MRRFDMSWLRKLALALCFCLAGGAAQAQMSHNLGSQPPGQFDFYVLTLSWQPSYCADTHNPNAQECGGTPQGFGLHGLWPQDANGYPSYCSNIMPTGAELQDYGSLFASPGLISHEWQRHGTCSGLAPAAYFELIKKILSGVTIPDAYKQATGTSLDDDANIQQNFQAANPSWPAGAVLVDHYNDGDLEDVEICFDKSGMAQACPQ
jgi:ribonuclease T2